MFNVIKTPRNYFTRELHVLHDSNVAFHCKKSLTAISGGKLSNEVFCRPSTAPVVSSTAVEKGRVLRNAIGRQGVKI